MAIDYRFLIRDIPDFPQAGIMFRDITPLLGDAKAYRATILALAEPFRDLGIDRVVGTGSGVRTCEEGG
jgi:adenine phosphoribosyltransferase